MKPAVFIVVFCLFAWNHQGSLAQSAEELVSDFFKDSLRIRERVKVTLDGSPKASGIRRVTQIVNELVFISRDRWRVRRDLPFTEESYEFLRMDTAYKMMNPSNSGVEPPFEVSENTYLEVMASPLRWAKEWSLTNPETSLADLLKKLKKGPLQNSEGDRLELEDKAGVSSLVKGTGKLLHDAQTQISIELTWELSERGKMKEEALKNSLLRSL